MMEASIPVEPNATGGVESRECEDKKMQLVAVHASDSASEISH